MGISIAFHGWGHRLREVLAAVQGGSARAERIGDLVRTRAHQTRGLLRDTGFPPSAQGGGPSLSHVWFQLSSRPLVAPALPPNPSPVFLDLPRAGSLGSMRLDVQGLSQPRNAHATTRTFIKRQFLPHAGGIRATLYSHPFPSELDENMRPCTAGREQK